MNLTFLGGADEVGASSTLLEIGGRRILIDAGIRPSPKARWGLAGDQLPDLSQIDRLGGLDAILVTHAHTGHTGALELVAGRYPHVPVYATPPTIALTRVLHQDARRIMQTRLDEEGELPLFDDVAVERLMASFTPAPFNTRLPLGDGLAVTFFPAGHIAGAAMIGLESDEGRVLITGDLSLSPQRTVDGARPPAFHPDLLIVESTYGGRLHANRAAQEQRLVETIAKVTGEGGKVLVPAFALGRAQEILLILGEFQRRGVLPPVPVWADGMVRAICQAYASFTDVLPLPLQERNAQFFEGHIRPVQTNDQRNALVWQPDPLVIVASSGMLAGGPSLSYARALASSPQHAILLTGYQDEESPGRRLQEVAERGSGAIRLGKEKVDVQCRLGTYSLSAHADEGQLISLVETLDPARVALVHGDEAARDSLAKALEERGRDVYLPKAGQSLEFRFAPARRAAPRGEIGRGPLVVEALWREIASPGGGYFTLSELARAWWGEANEQQLADLETALAEDDLYFEKRPDRSSLADLSGLSGVYRARTAAQIELAQRRREALRNLLSRSAPTGDISGRWLVLRSGGQPFPARCLSAGRDHLWVETDDGAQQRAWPEDVLAVLGDSPPDEAALAACAPAAQPAAPPVMEPNQALALANRHFPPEARLRKCGYRLDRRVLVLTFDFPDVARERYAKEIEGLATATGWQVELTAEANQTALNALARAILPEGWQIVKGPAIHREAKRVAITVAPPSLYPNPPTPAMGVGGVGSQLSQLTLSPPSPRREEHPAGGGSSPPPLSAALAEGGASVKAGEDRPYTGAGGGGRGVGEVEVCQRFRDESGYELSVVVAGAASTPAVVAPAAIGENAGARWEINAAYAAINAALAGSTLYRASLKGDEIVLSFISRQVGERYRAEIEALAQKTGWRLSVNPQPNQGAILEAARTLLAQAGWAVLKGPGIYLDKSEVAVGLATPPPEAELSQITETFTAQTGFRLTVNVQSQIRNPALSKVEGTEHAIRNTSPDVIEIPISKIRLRPYHQTLALDPGKLAKAVERARRMGQVSPPVEVRRERSGEGYILMDGLYRLRAAEALGWERIPAIVE